MNTKSNYILCKVELSSDDYCRDAEDILDKHIHMFKYHVMRIMAMLPEKQNFTEVYEDEIRNAAETDDHDKM